MTITEEEFEAEQGFDYSFNYSYNYGLISRFLTRTATNHVAAITQSADRVASYHRGGQASALAFDGDSHERVELDTQIKLPVSGTVSMWVVVHDDPTDDWSALFAGRSRAGHTSQTYSITQRSDGSIRPRLYTEEDESVRFNILNPTFGQLYHIAITWDNDPEGGNGILKGFVDGVEEGSNGYSGLLQDDNGEPTVINGYISHDRYGNATIDDARIYNRALSESEIQALYDGQHISDGLVGWWPLNDASGTTALDLSGNDNHGTLVNDPEWVDPLSTMAGAPGAPGRIANHVEGVSTFAGARTLFVRAATNHVEAITQSAEREASYHRHPTNHVDAISTEANRVASYHRDAESHVPAVTQSADHNGVTKPRTASNHVTPVTQSAGRVVTLHRTASNHVAPIVSDVEANTLRWRIGEARLDPETEVELDELEVTHDTITLGAALDRDARDALRDALPTAGDVQSREGAGGTIRAEVDDDVGSVPLHPAAGVVPPIDQFEAAVAAYDETQLAPDVYAVVVTVQRLANRDHEQTPMDETRDAGTDWLMTTQRSTLAIAADRIEVGSAAGDTPTHQDTLTLRCTDGQAAALLDDLGYPGGVAIHTVPGGRDLVEVPDRQVIDIDTGNAIDAEPQIDDGEYAVTRVLVTQINAEREPRWRVELDVLPTDD